MISVIIPTYNREKTIKRAIDSVLEQTCKDDIEVIIVDDGSKDNTEQIVKNYNDNRIIYHKKKNGGAASARNKGIELASGSFIAFQDSDDYWHKNKLERQLYALKKNNADITFCRLYRENYSDNTSKTWPNMEEKFVTLREILDTPLVSTQTVFGKAEVIKDLMFLEKLPALEDYCFSIEAVKKYNLFFQNEILVDLYLQEDSLTLNTGKYLEGYKCILQTYNDDFNKYPDIKAKVLEIIAGMERHRGINDYKSLKEAYYLNGNKKILVKYLLARCGLYSIIKNI